MRSNWARVHKSAELWEMRFLIWAPGVFELGKERNEPFLSNRISVTSFLIITFMIVERFILQQLAFLLCKVERTWFHITTSITFFIRQCPLAGIGGIRKLSAGRMLSSSTTAMISGREC